MYRKGTFIKTVAFTPERKEAMQTASGYLGVSDQQLIMLALDAYVHTINDLQRHNLL